MTLYVLIALVAAYHVGAGIKRGKYEHAGQLVETGAVAGVAYLAWPSLVGVAGLMLAGNVLFACGITQSFGGRWGIDPEEAWTFEVSAFGLSWQHPKWLWVPPSFAGRWRYLQAAAGIVLIIVGIMV